MAAVSLPIEGLRRAMRGLVLGPEDPGYDVARTTFNALIDRRHAVLARAAAQLGDAPVPARETDDQR